MDFYSLFLFHTLFVILGNADQSNSVKNKLLQYQLDQDDAFGTACSLPDILLEVEYDETIVNLGNNIDVHQLLLVPSFVGYADCDSQKYYDLVMFDPDAALDTKPFLHWWITNIPNCNATQGKIIADYIIPSPPPGPAHRYVFVLFEHDTFDDSITDYDKIYEKTILGRIKFSIQEMFCKRLGSGPVASNFFLTQTVDLEGITSNVATNDQSVTKSGDAINNASGPSQVKPTAAEDKLPDTQQKEQVVPNSNSNGSLL